MTPFKVQMFITFMMLGFACVAILAGKGDPFYQSIIMYLLGWWSPTNAPQNKLKTTETSSTSTSEEVTKN